MQESNRRSLYAEIREKENIIAILNEKMMDRVLKSEEARRMDAIKQLEEKEKINRELDSIIKVNYKLLKKLK